ncbi:MAG: rhomboid family intramembrane serine protease [Alphaproteobacteria bacterium]|nr:rhomboid family intramembrane serine protease [Alphaproteobacteria bacterium]
MLPLFDINTRVWIERPWVTWATMLLCVMLWLPYLYLPEASVIAFIASFGLVPTELAPHTFISSLYLHGGLAHLLGNMLYLWVFGDNVEDAMGHRRFLVFYLVCGVFASLGHVLVNSASEVPLVGASGAISGVLGAYLVLYPRARLLVPVLFFPLWFPAWLVIGFWFLLQGFSAFGGGGSGIAWWAHIFGFVGGLVLVWPMRRRATPLFGGGRLPQGVRLRRDGDGE